MREISILTKCRHPNMVQLFEVMDNPQSQKMYMVLEYIEGGEIEWRDKDENPVMTPNRARRIFRDIVNGLDYLHYQGVIHRDIKPANVLLSHDHVAKISDFGVSYYNELLAADHFIQPTEHSLCQMERELAETAGTPAFFAPELCCTGMNKRPQISKAVDVWALGVTLYCLLFGICPFVASNEFELFEIIPNQPLTFPLDIPNDLQNLLTRLLEKNPEKRITLDKVKLHPWVLDDLDDSKYGLVQPNAKKPHSSVMGRLRQSIRKLSCCSSKSVNHIQPTESSSHTLTSNSILSGYQDNDIYTL